MLPQKQ